MATQQSSLGDADDTRRRDIEAVLECLLNRGLSSEDDTAWFTDVLHEDLIRILLSYLNDHRHFLGNCHIENRQALNDLGVDILLSSDTFKAGFQIKSLEKWVGPGGGEAQSGAGAS